MQALVTDTASNGVSFGNSSPAEYRPELKLTPPLLRLHPGAVAAPSGISTGCVPGGSGTSSYVAAGGYLRTTAITDLVAPSVVESCAVARASSISLFPTEFAPNGVVVVELTRAMTRCTVSGAAHTPSVALDYSAVVKYWNGSAYQTLPTISPSTSTDPLDAVNLSTTSVGDGRKLGDYIASWSSLLNSDSEIPKTTTNGVAQVKLPGVITIASQPTRLGVAPALDATSVVSVAIGALGCLAEDAR